MKLSVIIAVLLLQRFKPFNGRSADKLLNVSAHVLERWFNAGEYRQGVVAWMIGVLPLSLGCGLIWWQLMQINAVLAWGWNIIILYVCDFGFKRHRRYFSAVSRALALNRLEDARRALYEWTGKPMAGLRYTQLIAVTIESALKYALRYVFAPMFWFILLPGPTAVVLYRLSWYFKQRWGRRTRSLGQEEFGRFFNQFMRVLNWAPMYLTAASFAITGNFEDAIHACRQYDAQPRNSLWMILAAGAGALGVQFHIVDAAVNLNTYGVGEAPERVHLQALEGLIWRSVLLWLLVIGILSLIV